MKKQLITLAAAAALLVAAQNSFAASAPAGTHNYQVILTSTCVVTTPADGSLITLGTQDGFDGNITNEPAGTVEITCSNIPYGICVSGTATSDATTRYLTHTVIPANKLAYALKSGGTSVGDDGCNPFTGVAETAAFASPVGGAVTAVPPVTAGLQGSGGLQIYDFFADVTIPPTAVPGTYRDDGITFTLVF